MLERIAAALLLALVVTLPFEFQTFPVATNLQWLFVILVAVASPIVFHARYKLLSDRRVATAAIFFLVQCAAALAASEFRPNAGKAAMRVGAGLILLCITLYLRNRERLLQAWCVSAAAAALYGILDYAGFGASEFFRNREFYLADSLRLSGSFEYPNTAAAYFAMSLPVVWLTPKSQAARIAASFLVWIALILTYSRGAIIAAGLVLLAWAVLTKSKSPLWHGALAAALYAALALIQPFVIQRFRQIEPDKALAAEYRPEFTLMKHRPKERGELQVTVKNVGAATWLPDGEMPVTLSYHWYDTRLGRKVQVAPLETHLSVPVRTGESASLKAAFRTPYDEGTYLLIWDLAQEGRGWFSASGVWPAVVETDIRAENDVWHGNGDVSHWYQPPEGPAVDAAISRGSLWKAAASLALTDPVLGAGPDNFRLLYGHELGVSSWDTKIRANSLYLEVLAGSGIIGLLALALMMASVPRVVNAATLALAVFLVHGLVDDFLMTTPIYFGFWILMGFAGPVAVHLAPPELTPRLEQFENRV
jgi:hypothetical protein